MNGSLRATELAKFFLFPVRTVVIKQVMGHSVKGLRPRAKLIEQTAVTSGE
jgi:hypothetical protein